MMELGRRAFPLSSFNPLRQKQQAVAQEQTAPRQLKTSGRSSDNGTAASQFANLQQCISAYLDSLQMVCRAGSWLAETFSLLLHDLSGQSLANEMKVKFSKMLQLSSSTTTQAKSDFATILGELSVPDNNIDLDSMKYYKLHNAKVMEKCIQCISVIHNLFFKVQLDVCFSPQTKVIMQFAEDQGDKTTIDHPSEWNKLTDMSCNVKSWLLLKERCGTLRKYGGLTDTEIKNLLNHDSVSKLYLEKLNQKIDTALRNYEVGLRGISPNRMTVFGGFHASSEEARSALKGCCSFMEMEQGIQRLPVSQFLHCELPLMTVTVNDKTFPTDSNNSSANICQKKNAIQQLLQSANQKLSISETNDLSSEILGEVCPARWRTHVKASLQLLYGNCGLIILDTVRSEANSKQNAVIYHRDSFIVVAVTSTWCIKEDPGTMSLLQRSFDPEKTLAIVHVRYVSVFNNKAPAQQKFNPGIFVETFVQTGSENRRRASQCIRPTQTLSGVPITPMSACWLMNQCMVDGSPTLLTRVTSEAEPDPEHAFKKTMIASGKVKQHSSESGSGSDRKRKKKLVVQIEESDTASEEEKSSDNDDSVKDVIHMLSGGSRTTTRRRLVKDNKDPETDEMSKATEDILDAGMPVHSDDKTTTVLDKDDVSPLTSRSAAEAVTLPLDNSWTSLYNTTPLHRKSKSQTLPLPLSANEQGTSNLSSNTLPQLGRKNVYWPSHFELLNRNPPIVPKSSLVHRVSQNHSNIGQNTVSHYPNSRSLHQNLPLSISSPKSMTASYPNDTCLSAPNILLGQGFSPVSNEASKNVGKTWVTEKHSTQPLNEPSWIHRSSTGGVQHSSDAFVPLSDYKTGQSNHAGMRALLRTFENLTTEDVPLQHQMLNRRGAFGRDFVLPQPCGQQHDKKTTEAQWNSNNNNILTESGQAPCQNMDEKWDFNRNLQGFHNNINHMLQSRGACHDKPIALNLTQFQLMSGDGILNSHTVPMQAAYQRRFGTQEDAAGRPGNSGCLNEENRVNLCQPQSSLGPIGSPIVKVGREDPRQQQGSNTWPCVQSVSQSTEFSEADADYEMYVVGIAKNTAQRKRVLPSSNTTNKDSITHSSIHENTSFVTTNASDSSHLLLRCDQGDRGAHDSAVWGVDATRTGTWPPWQPWGGSGMWNWSNDVFNPSTNQSAD